MNTCVSGLIVCLLANSCGLSAMDVFSAEAKAKIIEEAEMHYRSIPKAELHVHLGGAYPLEYLRTIAMPYQMERLTAGIKQLAESTDYQKVFSIFPLVAEIVNSTQKVEDGTAALLKAIEADGVDYAEIRTGLKDMNDGTGLAGYLNAVLRGIKRGCSARITAKLVLSVKRFSTLEYARQTVDLAIEYKEKGIVGIDISDISTKGDIRTIIPELLRAKKAGLFITAHVGENPAETDQMIILEQFQPERIGHGVHLTPEAQAWIKEHKTPVEMCLSSAVLCRMIKGYSDHPALTLLKEGHPVLVCTDDPPLFGTNLSKELALAEVEGGISRDILNNIAYIKSHACARPTIEMPSAPAQHQWRPALLGGDVVEYLQQRDMRQLLNIPGGDQLS